MKRFKAIGVLLALMMILTMSATVVVSAASVPKDLREIASDVADQTVTDSGDEASVSIPVQGFIVPKDKTETPEIPKNNPETSIPVTPPRTGDDAGIETYLILLLYALLIILFLATRKKGKSHTNLENVR